MAASFNRIGPQADGLLQRSGLQVLDVRDAESYLKGHIEGAQNISTRNLAISSAAPTRTLPALDPALRQWLTARGFGGLDSVIWNGTTLLMHAGDLGDAAMVRQLIAASARLDARNADGGHALWLACVGNHPDICRHPHRCRSGY